MRHIGKDYQRIQDPDAHIPEDEPVFILRAQDKLAPDALRHWIEMAKMYGIDKNTINQAEKQLERMAEWEPQGLPDIP